MYILPFWDFYPLEDNQILLFFMTAFSFGKTPESFSISKPFNALLPLLTKPPSEYFKLQNQ